MKKDLMFQNECHEELRSLAEVCEAREQFFHRVWYERHQSLLENKVQFEPQIFRQATEAAAELEEKYGKDNLGPYSDFEWGMINGTLSALRWVLGDEWGNLDS
jgi:hypothetical protein